MTRRRSWGSCRRASHGHPFRSRGPTPTILSPLLRLTRIEGDKVAESDYLLTSELLRLGRALGPRAGTAGAPPPAKFSRHVGRSYFGA